MTSYPLWELWLSGFTTSSLFFILLPLKLRLCCQPTSSFSWRISQLKYVANTLGSNDWYSSLLALRSWGWLLNLRAVPSLTSFTNNSLAFDLSWNGFPWLVSSPLLKASVSTFSAFSSNFICCKSNLIDFFREFKFDHFFLNLYWWKRCLFES